LLARGELLEERAGLQLHADPGQQPRVARPRILTEHAHPAAVRPAQPLDELQRRGLAGAVRAEDAEELAVGDGEADPSTAVSAP
jgi:hypothetical protein